MRSNMPKSMDAPAYEDGPTVEDTVPDRSAALAFACVEYGDLLDYCRHIIGAALNSLPPAQTSIVRLYYLDGLTLEDTALQCGMASKQAAKETEERALDRLARGKYRRELRESLRAFEDIHAAKDDAWSTSRTETAALRNIEKEVR